MGCKEGDGRTDTIGLSPFPLPPRQEPFRLLEGSRMGVVGRILFRMAARVAKRKVRRRVAAFHAATHKPMRTIADERTTVRFMRILPALGFPGPSP